MQIPFIIYPSLCLLSRPDGAPYPAAHSRRFLGSLPLRSRHDSASLPRSVPTAEHQQTGKGSRCGQPLNRERRFDILRTQGPSPFVFSFTRPSGAPYTAVCSDGPLEVCPCEAAMTLPVFHAPYQRLSTSKPERVLAAGSS